MNDPVKERARKRRYYYRHKKQIKESRQTEEYREKRRNYEQTPHRKAYRQEYYIRKKQVPTEQG